MRFQAKRTDPCPKQEATIFMVTHDSFAASFCDRVIILQDGLVRRTLIRDKADRRTFQDELLQVIRDLGDGEVMQS